MVSGSLRAFIPILALMLLLVVACSSEEAEPAPANESTAGATQASAAQQTDAQQAASQQPAAQQTDAQQTTAQQTTSQQPAAQQAASQQPAAQQQATETAPAASGPVVNVVTTSNIVADWVGIIGQDRVNVQSLLPAGADPHTYQPGAQDIAQVADADLVLSVGLSLEAGWLTELVEHAAQDPEKIIEIGNEVDPIDFVEIFEDHGHEEMEEMTDLLGKLLIGDGETGALSIIELDHGEVEQDVYDLGSRAGRIYATRSGRFAIAVSSDANTAHVIDGGLYLEAHDGHFDLVNREAEIIGLDLAGDRPVHLYVGDEWATIYYDGSGDVALINEHELEEEGAAYQPVRLNAGPQHGAAVPLEDDLFAISALHPDYASNPEFYRLPFLVNIQDLSGNILYTAGECPDLHGDAGNGHMAVFGCTGGVLVVAAEDGQYDHTFIGGPEGSPEDFRLTTVYGALGADHFFATGSNAGLFVVEPEEGEMELLIPPTEGAKPIQAALSRDGESLVVVLENGEIRLYDTHDGDVIATNADALTTPLVTGFWGRPHIAMAPGAIFVTDSVGGQVLQLDDHDLDEVNHWDVGGTPVKIAFVGIHGETEGHEEEGHGHEEEGDGHGHGELDPHFWFDPVRVKQAVNSIAARLSAADPAGQTLYRDNAAAYNSQLDDLHTWIQGEVATLPEALRLLVTSHDSFQYFANRYGFEVVGAIMPVTTEVEPSARDLAELVETIEESGAKAVFAEKTQTDRLARQVADETGAQLVGGLYTGSLGLEGGEAGTYLDYMRYNVTTIVEVLK